MNYSVKSISVFDRQAKRLMKKFPSLSNELFNLIQSLKNEPVQGVAIGRGCFKIRIAIASKGKGKSGGARIITHLHITKTTVFLLSIYDKSEQSNISDAEIKMLLNLIE